MAATETRKLCFVIGPIGKDGSSERKHSDMLLNVIIKDVLEKPDLDYQVRRADEDTDPGMINDRVITDILNADLVIADLTGHNPNVFYELGIRHLAVKPTIHITSAGTILPFDTHGHRTMFVDLGDWNSITSVRQRLADHVRTINAPNYKVSNPITQARATLQIRESTDTRDQVIAEMQERLSALETRPRIEFFESPPPRTDWNIRQGIHEMVDNIQHGRSAEAVQRYQQMFPTASIRTAVELVDSIERKLWPRVLAIHQPIAASKTAAEWFVDILKAKMD